MDQRKPKAWFRSWYRIYLVLEDLSINFNINWAIFLCLFFISFTALALCLISRWHCPFQPSSFSGLSMEAVVPLNTKYQLHIVLPQHCSHMESILHHLKKLAIRGLWGALANTQTLCEAKDNVILLPCKRDLYFPKQIG